MKTFSVPPARDKSHRNVPGSNMAQQVLLPPGYRAFHLTTLVLGIVRW